MYTFHTVAAIWPYSELHQELLRFSSQVFVASELLDNFAIINVKMIQSVVTMIQGNITLPGTALSVPRFCMFKQPWLNTSDLGVAYEAQRDRLEDDDDDAGDDVE